MADNDIDIELEAEITELFAGGEALRNLHAELMERCVAVTTQTGDKEVLNDALENVFQLHMEIESLKEEIEAWEDMREYLGCGDLLWKCQFMLENFQEHGKSYVATVEALERRMEHANTKEPVKDLVSAVITQQQIDNVSKKTCSVCLDDFKLEESVKKCSGCQNHFHNKCMWDCLAHKLNCPLCRSVLII